MNDSTPDTYEVSTSRGFVTLVSAEDVDLISLKWSASPNSNSLIYVKRAIRKDGRQTTLYMHRLVMERMLGRSLEYAERVDHIDNNSLNNRRDNLRLSTPTQNTRNSRKKHSNTSGYKGVRKARREGWQALIRVGNGERLILGTFDTPEEAHEAYKTAAIKYHGEFANFG